LSRRAERSLRLLRRGLAALLLLAASAAAVAAFQVPPRPERYVTDTAGVLGGRAEELNSRLEQYERETSNQILVWIAPRLPENATLEEFTVAAARAWKVGQAGKNNGAVLFVFTEDRKMRIEVGYGLEGSLPDATAHRIQEEEILPRFRSGDYAGGVEAGVQAMIAATKGEYKGSGRTVAEGSSRRRRSSLAGCIVPLVFLVFFILLPLSRLGRRGWRTYGSRGWWTGGGGFGGFGGGWGGGGGGFSGGGFSGGGFSGGGGSFGGGGSSGSW
jgi:uncharacterized protein